MGAQQSLWSAQPDEKAQRATGSQLKTHQYARAAPRTLTSFKMDPKEISKLEKRVVKQYYYLSGVLESMLICDNSLEDCPIVYVNDAFEEMSLYAKEEIVGRNCRFLQGRHTREETVKTIRKAVDTGAEIDVEILNYRKDGVPFLNRFLMLPIYKKTNNPDSGTTHFIAVQKDISVLHMQKRSADEWTSPEVGMWLDHIGLSHHVKKFLHEDVSGEILLDMDEADLTSLGMLDEIDRELFLSKLEDIQNDPLSGFRALTPEVDPDLYTEPAENATANILSPAHSAIWRKNSKEAEVPVTKASRKRVFKVSLETDGGELIDITLVRASKRVKFSRLHKLAVRALGVDVELFYMRQKTGAVRPLTNSDEVRDAVRQYSTLTVPLVARKRFIAKSIRSDVRATLDSLPHGVLLLDREGDVLFANARAHVLFAVPKGTNLTKRKIGELLDRLEERGGNQEQKVVAKALDETQKNLLAYLGDEFSTRDGILVKPLTVRSP